MYKVVEIESVKPNEYNPNKMDAKQYKALKHSVKRWGQVRPIVVVAAESGYRVIDGEHTLRCMNELGKAEIAISIVVCKNKREEKLLTTALDNIHGKIDEVQLAWAFKDEKFYKQELKELNETLLVDMSGLAKQVEVGLKNLKQRVARPKREKEPKQERSIDTEDYLGEYLWCPAPIVKNVEAYIIQECTRLGLEYHARKA